MLCINRGQAILNEIHSTRAIQKVTSGELLTKQTMRKNVIILRHYATSRKVAGSNPDEVDFFQLT
jgi:hypothetical protein